MVFTNDNARRGRMRLHQAVATGKRFFELCGLPPPAWIAEHRPS